jgi:hypothetical protein
MAKTAAAYAAYGGQLADVTKNLTASLQGLTRSVEESTTKTVLLEHTLSQNSAESGQQSKRIIAALGLMETRFGELAGVVSQRMRDEAQVSIESREALKGVRDHLSDLGEALTALHISANEMNLAAASVSGLAEQTLRPLPQRLTTALGETLGSWQRDQELLARDLREQQGRVTDAATLATTSLNDAAAQIALVAQTLGPVQSHLGILDESCGKIVSLTQDLARATDSLARSATDSFREIPQRIETSLGASFQPWLEEQASAIGRIDAHLQRIIELAPLTHASTPERNDAQATMEMREAHPTNRFEVAETNGATRATDRLSQRRRWTIAPSIRVQTPLR